MVRLQLYLIIFISALTQSTVLCEDNDTTTATHQDNDSEVSLSSDSLSVASSSLSVASRIFDNIPLNVGFPKMDGHYLYSGVALPENIIGHVMQNFMNFLSSSFLWTTLLMIGVYQPPELTEFKRRKRDTQDWDDTEDSFHSVTRDEIFYSTIKTEDDILRHKVAQEEELGPITWESVTSYLPPAGKVVWLLRELADTAGEYKRLHDEL